jgi:hypothetical protein
MRCNIAPSLCLLAAAALALVGCASQSQQSTTPQPVGNTFDFSGVGSDTSATPDEIVNADPSAARLEDIGGDLMLFYRLNRAMPPNLQALASVTDEGAPPNTLSPGSGQPYVYSSDGLWLEGHTQSIVVYDPTLSAKSMRWCLFRGPLHPNGSFSVEVVALPDSIFQTYKPSSLKQ